MDDDGLPCAAHIDLCCAGDVQVPQVLLQLRVGCFQIEEGLHELGSLNTRTDRGVDESQFNVAAAKLEESL